MSFRMSVSPSVRLSPAPDTPPRDNNATYLCNLNKIFNPQFSLLNRSIFSR